MIEIIEGAFNSLLYKASLLSKEKSNKIESRLNTCKGCDSKYFDNNTKSLRCGECGCFLQWLVSQDVKGCKLNKWK